MKTFRTHYDNLKVARDAPDIVIRAAYKSLSQRLHPDKNLGDERTAKIMSIINESYEVLCDPVKRREHDAWIARMEAAQSQGASKTRSHSSYQQPSSTKPPKSEKSSSPSYTLLTHVAKYWFLYGIAAFVVWGAFAEPSPPPPGPKPYNPAPTPTAVPKAARYIKPAVAPNGSPWPINSGYVTRYPQLNSEGLSSVTKKW